MTEASTTATMARTTGGVDTAVSWLEGEFPGWQVEVDSTTSWEGDLRSLWVARQDGHHPQAELSPAKLHSRLADYLLRIERKQALAR